VPSYLTLYQWTQKGIENAEESADRIERFRQQVSDDGARLVFFYMLMGEYDFATLIEADSDEAAAKIVIRLGELGNVSTHTMRAFTEDETKALLREIWPSGSGGS
jgi:uncharacterized protein with GYD domain